MKVLLLTLLLIPYISFAQEKPDSPKPKVASEMTRAERDKYMAEKYPDNFLHIDQPVDSFKQAATGRGMLIFEGTFIASNIVDEEMTQRCISNHTCHESNPIVGNSRAQAYTVGAVLGAVVIVSAVELRKHQHGSTAVILLWAASVGHALLAARAASY